jgi:hypothetical protein
MILFPGALNMKISIFPRKQSLIKQNAYRPSTWKKQKIAGRHHSGHQDKKPDPKPF